MEGCLGPFIDIQTPNDTTEVLYRRRECVEGAQYSYV